MTRFTNNIKTAVFLGALFALILAVGAIFGKQGLIIAFLIGGVMNIVAYFFSDKIALASMRAKEVDAATAPDLHTMVSRLATNADLPMPRVYICPHEAPNAFATGRNPANAAVAVTQGALRLLSYDELEGVMAHELAHVKNRDTLISCVAATIAGVINYVAWMAFWFGGNSRNGHPAAALLLAIFGPIAAGLIQMAISRSREFVADADGAAIAGSPDGLIGALRKLDSVARGIPLEHEVPTQNHMFIVEPFNGMGRSLTKLFSTHPPTEERIAKLQAIA